MARCTATESHDVRGGKFIKNESGILLTDGTDVLERWREYFDSLSSKPAIGSMMDSLPIHGPIREITETEVGKAVMHSSDGKTPGPSSITAEMLKALDASNFSVLTSVLQSVIDSGKIPDEWCTSDTVTIYKGKGDPLLCGSRQYVPENLVKTVMSLYRNSVSCMRRGNQRSNQFQVNTGVHQGSVLSPLLFILIIEELTKECGDGIPWEILFADDLVLTSYGYTEGAVACGQANASLKPLFAKFARIPNPRQQIVKSHLQMVKLKRPKMIKVSIREKKERFNRTKQEKIDWRKLRIKKHHDAYQEHISKASLSNKPSWAELAETMKRAAKAACGLEDTRSKTSQWMVGHEDRAR
ncbi:uncharacterized protein LOC134854726 [Symsagittifera roscoffensis]|uniref:uncharacterized protein LOC134854726 n=1 Tax=Symsagittifera roscoffensis TaxID=84072 RepID=UPI00307BAE31